MRVCVIGTGYVGLVSGTCFAEAGNDVVCVDVDGEKIKLLNEGVMPIYEPGLEPMVHFNVGEGRLKFTTELSGVMNETDVCFIAVGTPPNEDGSADLRHILDVANAIAKVARGRVLVGTKSTVPVGTGDKIEAIFSQKISHPFTVFSNPEFLKEGDAINDFMKPDRIILGLNDNSVLPLLRELYAPFTRQKDRLIVMSRRSAELTKYAANAMLATRISFMNEIANLCERVGANINDVRRGIGSDPRIGPAFLYPGIGYGGSCFPKDVQALIQTAKEEGLELALVTAADRANKKQKEVLFEKVIAHFGGRTKLTNKKIALWGLAFKAKTDDIRESSALTLIDRLLEAGVKIFAFDPQAITNASKMYDSKVNFTKSNYECLEGADALVIATEWNEFRSPDLEKIKKLMRDPVIFDGRNILPAEHLKQLGFTYYGIGV